MVIESSPLTLVATGAVAALGLALTVQFDAWRGNPSVRSMLTGLAISATGWAAWLVSVLLWRPEINGLLVLPLTALAGVGAVCLSTPIRLLRFDTSRVITFAAAWGLTVFGPVTIALFSGSHGLLGAGLGTLDLAGALPVLIAAGASGGAVLLLERRRPIPSKVAAASRGVLMGTATVVWLLSLLWMTGIELAIDEATGRIIVNSLVAPVASVVAWLIVERIRHAEMTTAAATNGILCGLVAIAPGCGYMSPIGAVATGLIAGAICSVLGGSLVRRTGQPAWRLVTILVVGGSTGVVLLGVFATRAGVLYTGQPEVLIGQFVSVVIVTIYAAGVSLLLWFAARALFGDRALVL